LRGLRLTSPAVAPRKQGSGPMSRTCDPSPYKFVRVCVAMIFWWWSHPVLQRPQCELKIIYEWVFCVYGGNCRRRLLLVHLVDWRNGHLRWSLAARDLQRKLVVGVWLHVRLFERRLVILLLLGKDLDCLSKLCESGPFSFNVMPSCFSPLGCCLPSGDSFLFFREPLYLLVHSG
jgi:hypothetical protein